MKKFQLHDYTFEEIQLLKCMAKYPDDAEFAAELINDGHGEYNWGRLNKMAEKFMANGILEFKTPFIEEENQKTSTIFKNDIQEIILNLPNPIPDKIKQDIDTSAILEKLSSSNLDFLEKKYITALLKRDIINQPQKI